MSQVLLISDSIENTRFDVARKTATFRSYNIDPVLAIPQIDSPDGVAKTDVGEILDYCFEECHPACIALSLIRDPEAVKLVADKLATTEHNAVVSEISLISSDGEVLVSSETYEMVIKYLLPQIQFLSLNIYEAELFAQMSCKGKTDIENAAQAISSRFGCIVYINGSIKSHWHDIICFGGKTKWLRAISDDTYIPSDKSLLAAIACELSMDKSIIEAIVSARKFFAGGHAAPEPAAAQAPAKAEAAPAPAAPVARTSPEQKAEPEKKAEAVKKEETPAQAAKPAEPAKPAVKAPNSYKPSYSTGGYSFTAMAAQRRREQAEAAKARTEAQKKEEPKPEARPEVKAEVKAEEASEPEEEHAPAPVKSLVSPAKSIRDIARSFEMKDVNESIAKKFAAEAEPAVTSTIEEPEPGPKGTVSEIKEREKRSAEQSLSELKALKEQIKQFMSPQGLFFWC